MVTVCQPTAPCYGQSRRRAHAAGTPADARLRRVGTATPELGEHRGETQPGRCLVGLAPPTSAPLGAPVLGHRAGCLPRGSGWAPGIPRCSCLAEPSCPVATLCWALRAPVPDPRMLFCAECPREGVAGEALESTRGIRTARAGWSHPEGPAAGETSTPRASLGRGDLSTESSPAACPLLGYCGGNGVFSERDGSSLGR